MNDVSEERDLSSSISTLQILYVLHALAPFTMWTLAVVAMVIGLVTRQHASGTWLDTHFSYLARTFWWGLLMAIIAGVLYVVLSLLTLGIGFFLFWILPVGVVIWYLYRVIMGWLALGDRKPI